MDAYENEVSGALGEEALEGEVEDDEEEDDSAPAGTKDNPWA